MTDGFTIGGVSLGIWETPQEIALPAGQKINKHVMIGGQRQIDAMGPDPGPISWSGRARGSTASGDMMAIRQMAIDGAAVELTWNEFYFLVVITNFDPKYQRPIEWTYSITVEIVDDPMADGGGGASSLDSLVDGDMSSLMDLIS